MEGIRVYYYRDKRTEIDVIIFGLKKYYSYRIFDLSTQYMNKISYFYNFFPAFFTFSRMFTEILYN